ncbi:exonuclease domain-containing protein [Staphylococcus hominis]|uniref:exonuclease domain-containing protein n=1 Tax=Staphylococcus hominis TaxID=1290 RepID=UPI002878FE36|nr:exonuclease domain-containing protein [Staphylococcus hominis]MDS3908732.1 exonuclease domain-containing protein [Staphylococcus hominis]
MKKALLWILLIFSLFTVVGGLLVIIDQGLSFIDLAMLLVFLLIFIISLFKLIKLNTTKKNKEITNQKEDIPIQLHEENKRLNKELNQVKIDLNNANQQLDENNKKPRVVEKEIIKEVESKELIENNENLKKELASQQDYILKLEKENKQVATLKENTEKTQKSIQELNEKLKVKENQIDELKSENKKVKEDYFSTLFSFENSSNEKVEPSRSSTHLDLSYTKARKLTSTFVVLDFETTGLNYKDNEIIQYGVVEFKDGNVINEFTKFFKPDQPVGKTVMRKTGITNEFLEDKPRISKEYMEELLLLLGGKTIVAHNAPFDMKFLLKNLHDFNIEHEKFRVFDTLTASRRLIHETPNHKLETLKDYFILDDGESHQALNDAKATGQLALLLIDRMK